MKKTCFIALLIMIAPSVFSYEIETKIKLDSSSSMEIQSVLDFPLSDSKTLLLNPRLRLGKYNRVDASMGIGFRHPVSFYTLGYYIYGDSHWKSPFLFYQLSPGIEFLAPFFELRLNYYHPISQKKTDDSFSYLPNSWMNLEGVVKFRYFRLEAGPTYNFKDKSLGSQLGIAVPFKNLEIGCNVRTNQNRKTEGLVFVTMSLFGKENKKELARRKFSPMIISKKRLPMQPIYPKEEIPVIIPVETPIIEEAPKEDLFNATLNQVIEVQEHQSAEPPIELNIAQINHILEPLPEEEPKLSPTEQPALSKAIEEAVPYVVENPEVQTNFLESIFNFIADLFKVK